MVIADKFGIVHYQDRFFHACLLLGINEVSVYPLQLERARNPANRLRVAQKNIAAAVQRVVEIIHRGLARVVVEIDKNVTAKDEVDSA
jgi:hypothetical protein